MIGLIPRKVLFGNPDKTNAKISNDGRYISYIAPLDGVLNVYVAAIDTPNEAKPVTNDTGRGIRVYYWGYDDRHLLYLQDNNGDENWHLYSVNIEDFTIQNLTDFPDTRVQVNNLSRHFPNEVIIEMNRRRKDLFDLYILDLSSGSVREFFRNEEYASLITDDYFKLRFAQKLNPDGSLTIYEFDQESNVSEFMQVEAGDLHTTSILDFDEENNLYMIDSTDRNTAALVLFNLKTKQKTLLYENDKADISSLMLHPTKKYLQAAKYNHLREEIKVFDRSLDLAFAKIKETIAGDLQILSRSLDDTIWIFADIKDNGPVSYYRYDRTKEEIKFLFYNRGDLVNCELVKMHPVMVKARDGLELVSYLTLPRDFDSSTLDALPQAESVPLILWVHGGPTARDYWGYDAIHQWLANRGYAVLSVNYRGSTGFGKDFINAGNGEWSRKMHTDLIDAVDWAIDKGITTRDKVAIGGGSYGGYAALVGLTFTPEIFKCAVDIVGPSNLETLLATIPPYWKPHVAALEKKLGGALATEEGRNELRARSPINFVDNISKPLLIGQGANDPRVKRSESDQIVNLMNQKGIPVTYILYTEEGHGFAKPENRMSFYALTELFLNQHLGGQFEEFGTDLKGANFEILSGDNLK
ncbi:S9 family peptidase [Candidatus Midichloria mitochondrii]|uniref:Dipeptidyl aminopeptidases/acylaminoacyl-peptidase n=1 Tax=Midichloria mitochondrii (strain IricVA) TaxID=696127 RepID=F7XUC5_MIDMI|nr:alpha/beta fold hydrolase [Candidatus Midichloria mitochondrii]AEI89484.1 dipeptidyl aminopeptidases/acylaminoacyl-peptidase [Candidatus Midichloria mitochondrii IricVA]